MLCHSKFHSRDRWKEHMHEVHFSDQQRTPASSQVQGEENEVALYLKNQMHDQQLLGVQTRYEADAVRQLQKDQGEYEPITKGLIFNEFTDNQTNERTIERS